MLDIPVYKSHVQALHLLASLYIEFKDSQHFQAAAAGDVEAVAALESADGGMPQTLSLE